MRSTVLFAFALEDLNAVCLCVLSLCVVVSFSAVTVMVRVMGNLFPQHLVLGVLCVRCVWIVKEHEQPIYAFYEFYA